MCARAPSITAMMMARSSAHPPGAGRALTGWRVFMMPSKDMSERRRALLNARVVMHGGSTVSQGASHEADLCVMTAAKVMRVLEAAKPKPRSSNYHPLSETCVVMTDAALVNMLNQDMHGRNVAVREHLTVMPVGGAARLAACPKRRAERSRSRRP
jgi:hypothetical protein